MTTYLLDANVLIALTVKEHEHHVRASAWLVTVDRVAVCPVVEGALVRFLVRMGEGPRVASELLSAVHASPKCEFWSDSLSYLDADLAHVRGHRQVTDAYLVSLVSDGRRGVLATLDEALARECPGSTVLVSGAAAR